MSLDVAAPAPRPAAGTQATGVYAGIDVGGSKIAILLADRELSVLGRSTVRTAVGEPGGAAGQIADALEHALAGAGVRPEALTALGVGVPGRVDRVTGVVSLAVNLGWESLAIGPLLCDRLGIPVAVENDVRAAVAGLHQRRILGDGDDIALLSIGTGISAGVVIDGRLHRGSRGIAGEIGHVVLDRDGPLCPCGLRGCLEALASGPAIARHARQGLDTGEQSSMRLEDDIHAEDVFRHALDGDALASRIVDAVGGWVARAVHELVMAYDVRIVAIGGGVAAAGPALTAPIERGLDRLRAASPLAHEMLPPDVLRLLDPTSEVGPWGAVLLARSIANGDGSPLREEEVPDG